MLEYFENSTDVISVQIKNCRPIDKEVIAYLITYILPLLTLNHGRYIIVLITLMLLICFLYIKSNMFAVNPFLMILGYHMFESDYKHDSWQNTKSAIILIRHSFDEMNDFIEKKNKLNITQINPGLLFGRVSNEE